MALLHDASSKATAGTGTLSWTHTPVTTGAIAVIVAITQDVTTTTQTNVVSYGGITMSGISQEYGLACVSGSEDGRVEIYYLLSGQFPQGAQTVSVTVTGAAVKQGFAATITGDPGGVTKFVQSNSWDGAASINLMGLGTCPDTSPPGQTITYVVMHSTFDSVMTLDFGTGLQSHDFGTTVGQFGYSNAADGTGGANNVYWHQTSGNGGALGVALTGASPRIGMVKQAVNIAATR